MKYGKAAWLTRKNLHLAVSAVIITPVALAYGLLPNILLPELFNFAVRATDLTNIFRATMGLYIAMAAFWVFGIFRPRYWAAATIANVVFMGGLAAGRLVSMAIDGVPGPYLTGGLLVEIALVVWGLLNLRRHGFR